VNPKKCSLTYVCGHKVSTFLEILQKNLQKNSFYSKNITKNHFVTKKTTFWRSKTRFFEKKTKLFDSKSEKKAFFFHVFSNFYNFATAKENGKKVLIRMGGFFPFLKCKFWSKSMMDDTLLNIIKNKQLY